MYKTKMAPEYAQKLKNEMLTEFPFTEAVPEAHYDDGRVLYWSIRIDGSYITCWFHPEMPTPEEITEHFQHAIDSEFVKSSTTENIYEVKTRRDSNPFSINKNGISFPARQALEALRNRLDKGVL